MIDFLLVATRPNALDREVSAISAHALLTQSPYALVDPARAAAAQHLQQFTLPVWLVTIVLQIAVLAWFWSSGRSARLRDRLRATIRSEFWVRFWFGALVALLDRAAALIPQFFQYRITRIMDLTDLLTRVWLANWIIVTVLAMIVAGLLAAIILELVMRTHQWYAYTIGGIMGFTLLITYINPFVFAPLASTLGPLPPSAIPAATIAQLRHRAQDTTVPIIEEIVSPRTHAGSTYIIGWGGSQRIVISDTLLAGETQPELRFVIARSFAWVLANDALHQTLVLGAMMVLGAALAVFLADRIGFRRDDDPVSRLALVGALLGCVYLIALPFYNSYVRNLDVAADSVAVTMTNDRASAIRGAVRGADQTLIPVCPNLLSYWFFATHPPAGERIPRLQGHPDICY